MALAGRRGASPAGTADGLVARPVSTKVNVVANDGPELLEPHEPQLKLL